MQLMYGLTTGILFGFILQRGRVLRYDKQIGALRLQDMTIVKFMLTAVLVGMVGIYFCNDLGLITLKIKPTSIGGNALGGILFGIGWGLLGYCPGTQMGALGEGRWDAVWGILGMLLGGALYAEAYPLMNRSVLTWGSFGKLTVPKVLGVNHWLVIPCIVVGGLLLFIWFEKRNL